ncbi:centrosomal protein of 170 kDa protein B isoform X1 [Tachysurus vachellii]|uniref:centrosomal protein of 170 kDa protein B isoform X1 n=1 Tax=Tachysurus vachellii TaxID=175792 RepID=UPI00296A9030|nr:centrosomal protein of 170 kDa protein B isoform X1 [Tachysurus vachellii]
MSVTSWFLVSSSGTRHRLPREMIFVGREDCELMLQSRSVDKQHAVINYNAATDEHLVKDLGSLNGTFVNDLRIPDQTYITLKLSDIVRFGYDSHVYILERSQHRVPEEALKHEKYTSQLQMDLKSSELKKKELQDDRTKTDRSERKSLTETSVCRPTPLYGQPSWWGEDDTGSKDFINEGRKTDDSRTEVLKEAEVNGCLQEFHDIQSKSTFLYQREPSYFEIPTKEIQTHSTFAEMELNDIPTKDTDALPKSTPPVYQSHASFTIEFDECTPGKIKIKDHVTKFSSRQRSKQPSAKVSSAAPTEVQSPESKVADWLVQSDVGMMSSRRPTSDDVYSTKSDLAMHIRTLKGHHHEDGTQSDSEDPVIKGKRNKSQHSVQSEEANVSKKLEPSDSYKPQLLSKNIHDFSSVPEGTGLEEHSPPTQNQMKCGQQEPLSQQAFIIEFFDDNPRKKRSQSFTHNPAHSDNYSALKAKLERRKGAERPASVHGNIPPTQQITVPLKGLSHGVHQRSSSLKREKTEETMSKGGMSPSSSGNSCSITSSSSRSSPAITIKPFGSIGKKSKLAQEFVNEFLNESSPPMSAPPVMMSPSHTHLPSPENKRVFAPSSISYPASPLETHTHSLPQMLLPASPPISVPSLPPPGGLDSSVSDIPPFTPVLSTGADFKSLRTHPKGSAAIRTEDEDSLSDAGTYTIETESQDKDVEEARSMIDQVFGVLDAPEYSGVYRPVINEQDKLNQTHSELMHTSAEDLNSSISADPESFLEGHSDPCGPKWVSRWASLADPCSDSVSKAASLGSTLQGTDSNRDVKAVLSQSVDQSESECTQSSKTRRLLPQVPSAGEKQESNTPCILIQTKPSVEFDPSENVSRTSQPDSTQRLKVHEDVDHDTLSDTSHSDDSSILDRSSKSQEQYRMSASLVSESIQPKSTSFYIGSEEGFYRSDAARSPVLTQTERAPSPKMPPTTVLIRHLSSQEYKRAVKPNSSAPNLQIHNKDSVPSKEPPSSSFVRQESFTKDRPSDNIQVKRLPHISSHPTLQELGTLGSEQEALSKENKQSISSQRQKEGGSPEQAEDSFSGESDVDTASTVSLVSSKNVPISTVKKRTSFSARKDKSSKTRQPTAREQLSEKRRNNATTETSATKSESTRCLHLRRSTGNSGSLDFSDNLIHSQTETTSSDHESTSRPSNRKKLSVSRQNQDSNKSSKAAHQVLTRSNSLSAPRPTRASMLRRARLGETSDNEGVEADRASQGSQHTLSSGDSKKLSRLDILAMPRKRTGSFTTPSDNESLNKQTHSRNSDSNANGRRMSTSETKPTKISPTAEKHLSNRTHNNQTKHSGTGSSRQRQKGSDYSSTSEEEHDISSKTKCFLTSASTQTQTPQRLIPTRLDIADDDAQNEHYQNWTNHSAEIARLSQDLAKDLAILAREIHDVAGDADTHTPAATGYNTPPGSAPHTPASTISAREELVHHIPDASLSYQKVPAGSPSPVDQDSDGAKRRPWNREEVILDNLMLNPVSQLSQAIRENTEQLTEKMKTLFHNTTDVWEEIEAKINAEDEVPIIKTSNKEISSILQELRRAQRQLEVINSIVEPGGGVKISAPPAAEKKKSSSAKSKRGGK